MEIWDPDSGTSSSFSDTVFEEDKPIYSRVLDSKGNPLLLPQVKMGFDLQPKIKKAGINAYKIS